MGLFLVAMGLNRMQGLTMRRDDQGEVGHRAEVARTQLARGRRDHEQQRLAARLQPPRRHHDCLTAVTAMHLHRQSSLMEPPFQVAVLHVAGHRRASLPALHCNMCKTKVTACNQ